MIGTLSVLHIEVIQAIQNIKNDIEIIKGKKTYARVFFELADDAYEQEYKITGMLRVNGEKKLIDCICPLGITNSNNRSLDQQRLNWACSLNFDVSDSVANTNGNLDLQLASLKSIVSGKATDLQINGDEGVCEIPENQLVESPYLYCTALVLRYWDSHHQEYIEPIAEKVDLIRQFVASAFPVAEKNIIWNSIHVSATDEFASLNELVGYEDDQNEVVPKQLRELLLQTALHRNQDLYGDGEGECRDVRTLYLGVFDDPHNRLGGAAIDSPEFPTHNIAGVTVVDLNGQTGAHEIAHALGRKHPGVPDKTLYGTEIGQHKEDESLNVPEHGFLSDRDNPCVGIYSDPRSSEPEIYEHNLWFDLMTYRYPQWISGYTYTGLMERLGTMNAAESKSRYEAGSNEWLVIGKYDLGRKTGEILYVLPTSYKTIESRLAGDPNKLLEQEKKVGIKLNGSAMKIRRHFNNDAEPELTPVYHRPAKGKDMPAFGIFQISIDIEYLAAIELIVAGTVVDRFSGKAGDTDKNIGVIINSLDQQSSNADSLISIENCDQYFDENRASVLVLIYSVEDDEYHLKFNWPENGGAQIVSTFQCENPNRTGLWETVLVTSQQRGAVWISPNFVSMYDSDDGGYAKPALPPYSFLNKKSRSIRDRSRDKLRYRVIFTSGFSKNKFQPEDKLQPLIELEKSWKLKLPNRSGTFRSLRQASP